MIFPTYSTLIKHQTNTILLFKVQGAKFFVMPPEFPSSIESDKTAIQNDLRAAFRSIRTSLKNIGFLVPRPSDSPMTTTNFELTGRNIEIMTMGPEKSKDLPWPLNTAESKFGIVQIFQGEQSLGMYFSFVWPEEDKGYERIILGFTRKRQEGFYYERVTASEPPPHGETEIVRFASGVIAFYSQTHKDILVPGTFEMWQKEEKPKLDKIVTSLVQAA